VPSAIRPGRPGLDVVALAKKYDLSLAYVPSMRNGSATDPLEREDRGNAILSTEPLSDARAIELPFGSGVSSFRPRSRRARVGRRAAAGDRDALDTTTGSPRPRPRDNPSPILERYHLSSAAI
jgi:hypothetical protein